MPLGIIWCLDDAIAIDCREDATPSRVIRFLCAHCTKMVSLDNGAHIYALHNPAYRARLASISADILSKRAS